MGRSQDRRAAGTDERAATADGPLETRGEVEAAATQGSRLSDNALSGAIHEQVRRLCPAGYHQKIVPSVFRLDERRGYRRRPF